MLVEEGLGEGDHVLRLGVEEADRLDRIAEIFFTQTNHLPRRLDASEQGPRGDVHAGVGGLSGENHGDQQLIGIAGFKLGRRGGIGLGQTANEFKDLLALHAKSSSARPRRTKPSSNSLVGRPNPMRKWSGISNQRPATTEASYRSRKWSSSRRVSPRDQRGKAVMPCSARTHSRSERPSAKALNSRRLASSIAGV